MHNTKNYTAQGGSLTVIGGGLQILGKLTIEPGAEVSGLDGASAPVSAPVSTPVSAPVGAGFTPVETVPDSTATTVAQLRDDFNDLLARLRTAGILAGDQP